MCMCMGCATGPAATGVRRARETWPVRFPARHPPRLALRSLHSVGMSRDVCDSVEGAGATRPTPFAAYLSCLSCSHRQPCSPAVEPLLYFLLFGTAIWSDASGVTGLCVRLLLVLVLVLGSLYEYMGRDS